MTMLFGGPIFAHKKKPGRAQNIRHMAEKSGQERKKTFTVGASSRKRFGWLILGGKENSGKPARKLYLEKLVEGKTGD